MSHVVGHYELGRVLGSGDFDCRTRLCTDTRTGEAYAVRIYDKAVLAECPRMWRQISEAVRLISIMPPHRNIIRVVDCFETTASLYILMELYSSTQITQIYTQRKNIPLEETRRYALQVAQGLLHMHGQRIAHLGLAPDHLLVNPEGQLRISALVNLRCFKEGEKMEELRGTTHTVAPEALDGAPYNPFKADSWAFGIVLFFMVAGGRYPHDSANTIDHIMARRMRKLDSETPEDIKSLCQQLLDYDPERRISVSEALLPRLQGVHQPRRYVARIDSSNGHFTVYIPAGLDEENSAAIVIQQAWLLRKGMTSSKNTTPPPNRSLQRLSTAKSSRVSFIGHNRKQSFSLSLGRGASQNSAVGNAAMAFGGAGHGGGLTLRTLCTQCGQETSDMKFRFVAGRHPYPNTPYVFVNGKMTMVKESETDKGASV